MMRRLSVALVCALLALAAHAGLISISGARAVSTGANSYSTSFAATENPISESSRWINGGATGLDWTNVRTTGGMAIGTQGSVSYTDSNAILTGTWAADQDESATVFQQNQNDNCFQEYEFRLRSTITAHTDNGYEISFHTTASSEAYLIVVRWNGPFMNFDYLYQPAHSTNFAVHSGDVLRASIVGNKIHAYINGTEKTPAGGVDITSIGGTVYSTGAPGIGFNLEGGNPGCSGTNGDYGFTDYSVTG